jgi:moderate conductance mechanosensitive channel
MLLASVPAIRPLTLWVERLTDNELILWTFDAVVAPIVTILMILVVAGLVLRASGRALRRLVERAKEPRGILPSSFLGSAAGVVGFGAAAEEARVHQLRREQRAEALGTLAMSVVRVLIWGFAGLTALGTVGVNLAPLIAGAGVLGVAIGFGAQDIVKDFLSGVIMLVEDQYGVGDVIDAGAATGVVEEVRLRTTRIRDVNGTVWHVPNGSISRVGNLTQEWSRMVIDVDVAYETDVDHAIEVLTGVLRRFEERDDVQERLLGEPMEIWGVNDLGDSSVAIRVVAKTVPGQQWVLGRLFRQAVKRELEAAGIEIPYPQRTVWHRGVVPAEDAPGAIAGQSSGDD